MQKFIAMREEGKYNLVNALERHERNPDSFPLPSKKEVAELKSGDFAKVIFTEENGGERMWVKIEKISSENNKKHFKGALDNVPDTIKSISCGETVEFTEDNIIDIMTD